VSWRECALEGIAFFVAMQVFDVHPDLGEGIVLGAAAGVIVGVLVRAARRYTGTGDRRARP